MKDLSIKAVVTSADGFYYREEHEWRGLPAEVSDLFARRSKEIEKLVSGVNGSTKEDGDVLTATLDSVADGVVQPQVVVKNLSYTELAKFQDLWEDWGGDLRSARNKGVKEKQKRKQEGRGKGRDR